MRISLQQKYIIYILGEAIARYSNKKTEEAKSKAYMDYFKKYKKIDFIKRPLKVKPKSFYVSDKKLDKHILDHAFYTVGISKTLESARVVTTNSLKILEKEDYIIEEPRNGGQVSYSLTPKGLEKYSEIEKEINPLIALYHYIEGECPGYFELKILYHEDMSIQLRKFKEELSLLESKLKSSNSEIEREKINKRIEMVKMSIKYSEEAIKFKKEFNDI